MERSSGGRIIVGVDESPHSRRALSWAVGEAELWDARLEVVHGWLTPIATYEASSGPPPIDIEQLEKASQSILEDAMASLGQTDAEVTPRLVAGEAAPVLTRAAEGADLLVVGSRGHGAFTGRLLGSVSQRCLESAACPVVVVPRDWKPRAGTIAVGVDGSAPSCAALRWAVAEANRRGARLEVVNAYHDTQVVLPFGPATEPDHEGLLQTSTSLLDHMIAEAVGRSASPQIETVSSPVGAAAALRGAASTAALLVVGSRGRGGLRALGLGSVSLHCLHHATCPVVVVRNGHVAAP